MMKPGEIGRDSRRTGLQSLRPNEQRPIYSCCSVDAGQTGLNVTVPDNSLQLIFSRTHPG